MSIAELYDVEIEFTSTTIYLECNVFIMWTYVSISELTVSF